MHRRLALAGTALLSLVAAGLTTLGLAPASPANAASPSDVRFGTFNIVTVSADGNASGERKVWRERRGTVISQILRQGLDVVGVQEANQSSIYGSRLVDDQAQPVPRPAQRAEPRGRRLPGQQRVPLQLRQGVELAQLPLPQPRRLRRQPDPLQHPHDAAAAQGRLQVPAPGAQQDRALPRLGGVPGPGDRPRGAVRDHPPRPLQQVGARRAVARPAPQGERPAARPPGRGDRRLQLHEVLRLGAWPHGGHAPERVRRRPEPALQDEPEPGSPRITPPTSSSTRSTGGAGT